MPIPGAPVRWQPVAFAATGFYPIVGIISSTIPKQNPLECSRGFCEDFPGIVLFSQAVAHLLSSPQRRFTSEFGMDRRGSTAL